MKWGHAILKAAATAIHGLLPSKDNRSTEECRQRNDRQSYFNLTRQLVSAQFVLADGQLAARLWQEVADREDSAGDQSSVRLQFSGRRPGYAGGGRFIPQPGGSLGSIGLRLRARTECPARGPDVC